MFHTSQFKKGLWITLLTALVVFSILFLAPKIFASEADKLDNIGTPNGGLGGIIYDGGYVYDGSFAGVEITSIKMWLFNAYSYSPQNVNCGFGTGQFNYSYCSKSFNQATWPSGTSWPSGAYYTFDFTGEDCVIPTFNPLTLGEIVFSCDYPAWGVGAVDIGYIYGDFTAEEPPTESYLTIDSPTSGSTASSTFSLDFTYNFVGEDSNKMYVVFEAWNASSTCPIYGTETWQTEYSAGWFYNQSLPYFSPRLTATSTEATSSISVYNLEEPYLYNCNYCYFYNEDTATSTLVNKCPDYLLNVSGYVAPSQPVPIGSWQNYYASHTSDKFGTSTEIFDSIAGTFNGIVSRLTSFVNDFRGIFDAENANAKGEDFGEKIPLVRGYLKPINDFFGGMPVSELFVFVLIVLLVVVIYRIVARILHLIRG